MASARTPVSMNAAFSLVELSIVLVILGLLTGGILAGQSLIRASELRSVIAQADQYRAATHTFHDKYFAFPGDMPNATSFWGDNPAECSSAATQDGTTCNGNGNGVIDAPNAGDPSNMGMGHTAEMHQFWNHLALANLIEGSYTGIAGLSDTNGWNVTPGLNAPGSKISGGKWTVTGYIGAYVAGTDFNFLDWSNQNRLMLGAINSPSSYGTLLKPEEAWNIDVKLDDGKPARGMVREWYYINCTTGTNSSDFNAEYALTYTSAACAMLLKI